MTLLDKPWPWSLPQTFSPCFCGPKLAGARKRLFLRDEMHLYKGGLKPEALRMRWGCMLFFKLCSRCLTFCLLFLYIDLCFLVLVSLIFSNSHKCTIVTVNAFMNAKNIIEAVHSDESAFQHSPVCIFGLVAVFVNWIILFQPVWGVGLPVFTYR